MLKRQINFYMGALLITVVGAVATIVITRTAAEADSFVYTGEYFEPADGTAEGFRPR